MIKIQKANIEDLKNLRELDYKHFLFADQFGAYGDAEWANSTEGEEFYKKAIQDKTHITLLAFSDNVPIAYIIGNVVKDNIYKHSPVAEIIAMYIKEDFRGQEIGTKLVTEFKSRAKAIGAKSVKVLTHYNNATAIKFYKKNGFKDYAVTLYEILDHSPIESA